MRNRGGNARPKTKLKGDASFQIVTLCGNSATANVAANSRCHECGEYFYSERPQAECCSDICYERYLAYLNEGLK